MHRKDYTRKIEQEAAAFASTARPAGGGEVAWDCPSNIAIVKYWGKKRGQIPTNPSLSMTLSEAFTSTTMRFDFDPARDSPDIGFRYQGAEAPGFARRVRSYLEEIATLLPYISHSRIRIDTRNTFPHSSGIASSASSLGALALCLVQAEALLTGKWGPDGLSENEELRRKASFLARLGSGSASRSIYPGFALWGSTTEWKGSSDVYAIPVGEFHPEFFALRDAILIVESGRKEVSSSAGHALMENNPYAPVRFGQAQQHIVTMKEILKTGDWNAFLSVLEEEALSLHAMMMTGRPGYLLMKPDTVAILHKIRAFRTETSCRAGFTLDAGANVHLIYADGDAGQVEAFIASDLKEHCENGMRIMDRMGEGPHMVAE